MMKRQKTLVFSLVLVLVLVIFAVLNTEPVEINFAVAKPKIPLIIVLVVMLLLGALVSWLLGSNDGNLKKALHDQKAELVKSHQQQLDQKNQEIDALKAQAKSIAAKAAEPELPRDNPR